MKSRFFIDMACPQINCHGERICGDSFLCERLSGGGRTIIVLSDGMGHGVKANILAVLTSTMLSKFLSSHEDISVIAEMLLKTLPVCSVRKISYSTFTIIDIDSISGDVRIVEHDNPRTIIMRGDAPLDLEWERREITSAEKRTQHISQSNFKAQLGDRLVVVTDGVTQSGQRTGLYKFGWGEANLAQFVTYLVGYNSKISSRDLALQVLSKASLNDDGRPSDDISCMSLYIRDMRSMLLVSCPPSLRENYGRLAETVARFEGTRAVCGYRVAEIIAEQNGWPIKRDEFSPDPAIPPQWHVEPLDLVTEGLVTLGRVLELLEQIDQVGGDAIVDGRSAADRLYRAIMRADQIEFLIGTVRNSGSTYQTDEFDIRRNVLQNIANLLVSRYEKQVNIMYI